MKNVQDNVTKRVDDYLEHHGIQGQKWGVKHGPPYPLDRKEKSKINYKTEISKPGSKNKTKKTKPEVVTIKVRDLSDDDLQRIVRRMQMEKQLKDLTTAQTSKGKKYYDKTLERVGDTGLDIVLGAAKKSGTKALSRLFDQLLSPGKNKKG